MQNKCPSVHSSTRLKYYCVSAPIWKVGNQGLQWSHSHLDFSTLHQQKPKDQKLKKSQKLKQLLCAGFFIISGMGKIGHVGKKEKEWWWFCDFYTFWRGRETEFRFPPENPLVLCDTTCCPTRIPILYLRLSLVRPSLPGHGSAQLIQSAVTQQLYPFWWLEKWIWNAFGAVYRCGNLLDKKHDPETLHL